MPAKDKTSMTHQSAAVNLSPPTPSERVHDSKMPFRAPSRWSLASSESPTYPTLRANPFPKVTDLFCRLPLPTLFYQLEAVHLGDLLRLWVRLALKMTTTRMSHGWSLGFSRTVDCAPDHFKLKRLFQSFHPFARSSDFRVHPLLKRKENSSQDNLQRFQVLLRYRSHPKV